MFDLKATASSLLGGGGVETFFAAGASGGASSEQQTAQVVVQSQQREINRIRGYKLRLSPAENFRLGEIQSEILKIQENVNKGVARPDELEDRTELYKEADRIIGKPVLDDIDTETDEVYIELVSALEELLQPKLAPAVQARVDSLERIKEGITDQLGERPDSPTLLSQFKSVSATLDSLAPLRRVADLSVQERRLYDDAVSSLNEYVGAKLQLESHEAIRVSQLEQSIQQMSANLPPDPASQPTSGAVNRAISRVV